MLMQKTITGKEKSIKTIQQEKKKVKAMKQFRKGELYCDECGEKIEDKTQIDIATEVASHKTCIGYESCDYCGKAVEIDLRTTVYASPFHEGDKSNNYKFCSDNCRELYTEDTFFCNECGRQIALRTGRRDNIKFAKGSGMCVACYQDMAFKQGEPERKFSKGLSEGLIKAGDFFKESELLEYGYKKHKKYFVKTKKSTRKLNREACKLLDIGLKVILNYENLSHFGGEGTVSLYIKY